jgi:hypothetical protein
MRRWTRALVFLIVGTFIGNRAAAAASVPTAPTNPDSKNLDNGGFELSYPYWVPEGHGAPKALVAQYTWRGQPRRTATAKLEKHDSALPKDWRWLLTFTDQPKPDELAHIDLLYEFDLTASDRADIAKAAKTLADNTVKAYAAALRVGKADKAAVSRELEPQTVKLAAAPEAQLLQKFGDDTGKDGIDIFLTALGLERQPSGGWTPTADSAQRFIDLAAILTTTSLSDNEQKARAEEQAKLKKAKPVDPKADTPCTKAGGDGSAWTVAIAQAVLAACVPELAALVKPAGGDAAADALTAALADWKKDTGQPFDDSVFAPAAKVAPNTLRPSYPYNASQLAAALLLTESKETKWQKELEALVGAVVVAFERANLVQPGSTVVAGGQKPRRYDISTGAIYVGGIHDVIVPMMISICGWEGCLKQDEVAWEGPHGWQRAFSVDAGIRVKTIDTPDPRPSGTLSFVGGLSFNPISVLRLSGGGYAFENGQTGNWNLEWYCGITFNVLNAAEILGGLELGPQFAPKPIDTK